LYEHVHSESTPQFLRFIEQLLRYGFVEADKKFSEEQDFNLTLYKTFQNRVILKSATVLQYDTSNRVRYSIGKLMDVTSLIPYQRFSYKFIGPGSKSIYAAFDGLTKFVSILSPREMEILKYVGLGMASRQISEKLHLSRHTVDTHKRNIIRKLEAANSIDAFNKAQGMGLYK
jgi:DNA-binding CsgD family transcriptional regulator